MRFFSNYYRSNNRLNGKTIVITGANCGIGKETAKDLYKRGKNILFILRIFLYIKYFIHIII